MIEQTSESVTLLGNIDPSVVYEVPSGAKFEIVESKQPVVLMVNDPRSRQKSDDVISVSDEAALIGFFATTTFERSTFGAIVEHLMYTAMGSHACARCNGEGVLNDGGFRIEDKCRRCNGNGFLGDGVGDTPAARRLKAELCPQCLGKRKEASYEVKLESGGWCTSCRGTGAAGIDRRGSKPTPCSACPGKKVPLVATEAHAAKSPKKPKTRGCGNCGACKACRDARACRDCRNCLGTGVEPISVHQTGEDGATGRDGADEGQLTKYALTSRRLQRVRDKSPALFRAIGKYYGEEGEHWGLTDRGRIFALYAETPAGKALVKLTKREKGKPWTNPTPRPVAEPADLESLHELIDECTTFDKRRARKHRRPDHLREFIGPLQEGVGWLDAGRVGEHETELLKNPDGSAKHETHAEIIARVGNEERTGSSPRRQLFTEAGKQARQLYAAAVVAWNEARRGRQTRASRALVKRATSLGLTNLASHIADVSGSK